MTIENHINGEYSSDYPLDYAILNKILGNDLDQKNRFRNVGPNNFGQYNLTKIKKDRLLVDGTHEYLLNKNGYRSPEFKNNTDIVFAGCSQTYGIGICEQGIWGSQIAKKMNLDYANISRPGASVSWIVRNLFAYFKEHGNPKYLFCLFPDFYRLDIPMNPNIISSRWYTKTDSIVFGNVMLAHESDLNNRPEYSKKPHNLEDIFPIEIPFYDSCQHILMLEQYCRSNSITLIWSSWFTELFVALKTANQNKKYYEFFLDDTNIIDWLVVDKNGNPDREGKPHTLDLYYPKNKKIMNDCHKETQKIFSDCFNRGLDIEIKEAGPHFGVHRHTHIAESFLKALNK
jgi:hypothetical protein